MTVPAGRFLALRAFPPNTQVTVYSSGTLASLYTDKDTGTAAPNPVAADAFGNFQFYAASGDYELVYPGVEITVTVWPDPSNA